MSPKSKLRIDQARKKSATVARLVKRLQDIRIEFTPAAVSERATLLEKLTKSRITQAKSLEMYHDTLCFMRAYPESKDVLRITEKELVSFSKRTTQYGSASKDKNLIKLADTGIVDTTVTGIFSYDLTCYLVSHFGSDIDLDWEAYESSDTDPIWDYLPLIANAQEVDTFDNAGDISTLRWLKRARSTSQPTTLSVLISLLKSSGLDHATQRFLFEHGELTVIWKLVRSTASRTLKRVPQHEPKLTTQVFYQSEPLRGRSRDLISELSKPVDPLVAVSHNEAKSYTDDIKEILGVRLRELYSLTGSNAREVYRCDPGRGIRFVIFGNNPDIRLPLETNFGAMILRNGLPIGYGVCAMLFDRAEIAINIFPAFRAGESPFIIEQFFHLFHKHFGAKALMVRSYQVGDDNDEALESGSFWFYYKLGFRPVQPLIRALAAKEAAKVKNRQGYRSPISMLKRLAVSDVFLHTDTKFTGIYKELSVSNLGLAVTDLVARKFGGDRADANQAAVVFCEKYCEVKNLSRASQNVRDGFTRMAPLVMSIPDLPRWPRQDRLLLGNILLAKGGDSEKTFLKLCQEHPRLESSLRKLASSQSL